MRETVKLSAALTAREVVKDRGYRYTEQTELPHAPMFLKGAERSHRRKMVWRSWAASPLTLRMPRPADNPGDENNGFRNP